MDDELTPVWRLPGRTRVIALGVIIEDGRLLVSAVTHDDGSIKGWRVLGGGVEFGERAAAALCREFDEELGAQLRGLRQIGVMENLFEHAGAQGHEVAFLFAAELAVKGKAAAERFILEDGAYRNQAAWIALDAFQRGDERLLPDGLLGYI
ncbi:MAG: NUDIX domain-containing protein [Pseudorhodobacter sp.]